MRLDDLDDGNLNDDISVEDQRGSGGGGFGFPMGGGLPISGKMGCGSIILLLIAALVFGVNPGDMLGGGQSSIGSACAEPVCARRCWSGVQRKR